MKTVDAPKPRLEEDQMPGEILLNFYRDLGWDGMKELCPWKIKTTREVYNELNDAMYEHANNSLAVGFLMVNNGPSVDETIAPGKVQLWKGWVG